MMERNYLSIIVICFNMRREAPRTIYSLSKKFQKRIRLEDYEIIVIDNDSTEPLEKNEIENIGSNISYYFYNSGSQSPVGAINYGVEKAKGEYIGILIDGARIMSPMILNWAIYALQTINNPFISTLSWHLGHEQQFISVPKGYTKQHEDKLLEEIDWKNNGYNLFSISSFAGSSKPGFFQSVSESNAIFLDKSLYYEIGGYDICFDLPGGGYCNLDFYKRACEYPDVTHVILLGEGTFHQYHGGITTSSRDKYVINLLKEYELQYSQIRKESFVSPKSKPVYIGIIPDSILPFIQDSITKATDKH